MENANDKPVLRVLKTDNKATVVDPLINAFEEYQRGCTKGGFGWRDPNDIANFCIDYLKNVNERTKDVPPEQIDFVIPLEKIPYALGVYYDEENDPDYWFDDVADILKEYVRNVVEIKGVIENREVLDPVKDWDIIVKNVNADLVKAFEQISDVDAKDREALDFYSQFAQTDCTTISVGKTRIKDFIYRLIQHGEKYGIGINALLDRAQKDLDDFMQRVEPRYDEKFDELYLLAKIRCVFTYIPLDDERNLSYSEISKQKLKAEAADAAQLEIYPSFNVDDIGFNSIDISYSKMKKLSGIVCSVDREQLAAEVATHFGVLPRTHYKIDKIPEFQQPICRTIIRKAIGKGFIVERPDGLLEWSKEHKKAEMTYFCQQFNERVWHLTGSHKSYCWAPFERLLGEKDFRVKYCNAEISSKSNDTRPIDDIFADCGLK